MEQLIIDFFVKFGLPLTGIALVGIIALGVLKYCDLFQKINKDKRHIIYLAISIGFSLLGSLIYLLCVNRFEINYFLAIATALFAINQAAYNIFDTTHLKDLFIKILDAVKKLLERSNKEDK